MSAELLKIKVLELIHNLQFEGGTSGIGNTATFDYYAIDYLEFAEQNLENFFGLNDLVKENELLSCVANLKRAIDNQIECFLEFWNLRKEFSKKNLNLESKLKFLNSIGIFNSRTINNLGC